MKGRLLLCLLLSLCAFAKTSPSEEEICNWPKEWRKKALMRLDLVISQALPFSSRTFCIHEPKKAVLLGDPSLETFLERYGYFSCQRPLVGIVTKSTLDIRSVEQALLSLGSTVTPRFLQIAVGELLTKALAYRNLEEGVEISIPTEGGKTITYRVDAVLDLWHGMPAFGLAPLRQGEGDPILLFRGTDFSLLSRRSWASILSDLDTQGVGLSTFHEARPKIHGWLEKMSSQGRKAKVMGFSLGGVLALYTVLFEGDLISSKGSLAFNAPGVSPSIFAKWTSAHAAKIAFYITEGDLVSKLGKLVEGTFLLSTQEQLGPIDAHTRLMTGSKPLFFCPVRIEEENQHRFTTN